MFEFFKRQKVRPEVPRLKPRNNSELIPKVSLAELSPDPILYLAQAAYLQLSIFEALSATLSSSPTVEAKEQLSAAAAAALDKHHRLVAELSRKKANPVAAMQPFAAQIDAYSLLIRGANWYESLASIYLCAGILDDFFVLLASGIRSDLGQRAAQIIGGESSREVIVSILRSAIEHHPPLASMLALWGRRLVGDTLLMAHSAISNSANQQKDEKRIEPVFTELISQHSQRMDGLGLTA